MIESQSGAVMASESTDEVKTAILSRSKKGCFLLKDRAGSNQNQEATKEAESAIKEVRTDRAR